MKKLRLISMVLAVLMIFSTFGFSSAVASENPVTKRDKLAMALELASKGLKTGATYIPETVEAFEEATNEARLVFIDKYSTNKEVSAALKNLEDALYGLETVNLYKDGLWQAFHYIENLNPDDYTEESFQALLDAQGQYHFYYYVTSQQEIDDAVNAINEAIMKLEPVGDATVPVETPKDKLIRYYNRASYFLHSYDAIFTTESEEALHDAVVYAEETLNITTPLQNEIYEYSVLKLTTALENLKELHLDLSDLENAVRDGYYYYENEYRFTEESYDRFMWIYYDSKSKLSNAQSQEEADKAAEDLYMAIQMLVPEDRRGDYMYEKERFYKLYNEGDQYLYVRGIEFEEGCRQNLLDALNKTNQYLGPNQFYEEYVEASALLEDAISKMKIISFDKEPLLSAIEICKKVNPKEYTTDSYEVLSAALLAATDAYNTATTQEELNKARGTLLNSYDNLVAVGEVLPPVTSPETEPQEISSVPSYTETITTEPMETETSGIITEPTEPSQPIVTEPSEIITIPPVTETPSEPASSEPKETENTDETTLPPNFVFYTLGDTDLNDKVTIKDATLIQKHLAMITELENEALLAADANEDQNITIKDTTEIQKFLANLPANEKIGEFCVIVAE